MSFVSPTASCHLITKAHGGGGGGGGADEDDADTACVAGRNTPSVGIGQSNTSGLPKYVILCTWASHTYCGGSWVMSTVFPTCTITSWGPASPPGHDKHAR